MIVRRPVNSLNLYTCTVYNDIYCTVYALHEHFSLLMAITLTIIGDGANVSRAVLNSLLMSAGAALSATLFAKMFSLHKRKWPIRQLNNGLLAGLVLSPAHFRLTSISSIIWDNKQTLTIEI